MESSSVKRTCYFIVLVLAMLTVLGWWLVPRTLALYYQIQGAKLLEGALGSDPEIKPADIYCAQDPLTDKVARAKVEQAIGVLQKSASYDPRLARASLLIGRVYCLLGEYEKAIDAYRNYTNLLPGNPLGHIELAYAYIAAGHLTNEQGGTEISNLCKNRNHKLIIEQFQKAGIDSEQLQLAGSQEFTNGNYKDAQHFFQDSYLFGKILPNSVLFRWAIASILTEQKIPQCPEFGSFQVYPVAGSVQIEGRDLYWMMSSQNKDLSYGQKLKAYPGGDLNFGVLWWSGPAIAILNIPCEADYDFTIRASHFSQERSTTGYLEMLIDTHSIDRFAISSDWSELHTSVHLTRGLHVFSLNYIQDVGDVILDWIRVRQLGNCQP